MSNPVINGGPAFPVLTNGKDPWGHDEVKLRAPGMTLRDYFAGQALVTMATSHVAYDAGSFFSEVSAKAYKYADAMLKAREEKP